MLEKHTIMSEEMIYINDHFIKRITYLMMHFGLTKSETAKKANIARSTFYRYLNGEILPTDRSLFKLSKAFDSNMKIFLKKTFIIRKLNPDTQNFNIKYCEWADDDSCFYILKDYDSPQNVLDLDEQFPKSTKSSSSKPNKIHASRMPSNCSATYSCNEVKLIKDSPPINCSLDQLYKITTDIFTLFQENPNDQANIFSKVYEFVEHLKDQYR